jgi:hypothetical protein
MKHAIASVKFARRRCDCTCGVRVTGATPEALKEAFAEHRGSVGAKRYGARNLADVDAVPTWMRRSAGRGSAASAKARRAAA